MNKEQLYTHKKYMWIVMACIALGVGIATWLTGKPGTITEPLPISEELKSTLEPMPEPIKR